MTPDEIEGTREREIESEVRNIENFDTHRQRDIEVIETCVHDVRGTTDRRRRQQTRFQDDEDSVRDAGTDENAVLGYARDVTDRKEYERELERTNEKLDSFAGVASHDLRNPSNVAQGRLELADGAGAEHIVPAQRSLNRMERTVEDILTLSRAGETIEDPEQVALADVVRESWGTATTDTVYCTSVPVVRRNGSANHR